LIVHENGLVVFAGIHFLPLLGRHRSGTAIT
jgi:hypothetical protein